MSEVRNACDDDMLLDEVWALYFHDPLDKSWTMSSYVYLTNISSARDFASVSYALKNNFVCRGMFFLMRELVFPCWDDKHNIDGGCACIKVPVHCVPQYWKELCMRLLTESMWKSEEEGERWSLPELPIVNGISISPKMNCSVAKIWLGPHPTSCNIPPNVIIRYLDLPIGHVGDVIYKYNRDNISSTYNKTK